MRECWKNIDRNCCLVIDRPAGGLGERLEVRGLESSLVVTG